MCKNTSLSLLLVRISREVIGLTESRDPIYAQQTLAPSDGKKSFAMAHIADIVSQILTNFVPQKLQIFIGFLKGTLYYCAFFIWGTMAIKVKLVKNWNMLKIVKHFTCFFCKYKVPQFYWLKKKQFHVFWHILNRKNYL